MQNPWNDLPQQSPFILPIDQPHLNQVTWKDGDRSRLRFEMYPVPYLGNPDMAEVYLLTLNPGFTESYKEEVDNPDFVQELQKSYTFKSTPPLYVLDPRFSQTGGFLYYAARLKELIDTVGWHAVVHKVMILEFSAYHSQTYRQLPFTLPSQHFSFALVKQAMAQKKTIIFQRSKKLWIQAIPELADYPTLQLNSYRAPYVSKKNLGEAAFQQVVQMLQ